MKINFRPRNTIYAFFVLFFLNLLSIGGANAATYSCIAGGANPFDIEVRIVDRAVKIYQHARLVYDDRQVVAYTNDSNTAVNCEDVDFGLEGESNVGAIFVRLGHKDDILLLLGLKFDEDKNITYIQKAVNRVVDDKLGPVGFEWQHQGVDFKVVFGRNRDVTSRYCFNHYDQGGTDVWTWTGNVRDGNDSPYPHRMNYPHCAHNLSSGGKILQQTVFTK